MRLTFNVTLTNDVGTRIKSGYLYRGYRLKGIFPSNLHNPESLLSTLSHSQKSTRRTRFARYSWQIYTLKT